MASIKARRRRQHVRIAGFVVSITLHCCLLLAFLPSAPGELISGGASSGAAAAAPAIMSVSLVAAPSLQESSSAAAAEPFSPLLMKVRAVEAERPLLTPPAGKSSRFDDMKDRITKAADASAAKTKDPPSPQQATVADAEAAPRRNNAPGKVADGPTGGAPSTGDLWGRIEPCWRSRASSDAVGVTLEVIVDNKGKLGAPPRILRPSNSAIDDRRLRSEARAMASIAECLPRGSQLVAGGTYRLEFN